MKKRNDGKEFESLTTDVFEILTADEDSKVEKDVKLDGIDGPRQIDVLVRSQVAGIDIRTIVECRDYSKRLDITHVDGLHSKMPDVNADKAVIVSRNGFSEMAIKKAARVGITLCTLDGSKKAEKNLDAIGREVPILIKKIDLTAYLNFAIVTEEIEGSEAAMQKPAGIVPGVINEVVLTDRIHEAFLSGEITVEDKPSNFEWIPPNIIPPYYAGSANDDPKLPIRDLTIQISYVPKYYFGYASEFNDSLIFKNLSQKTEKLIFNLADIADEIGNFAIYQSPKEIPVPLSTIEVHGISVPKLEMNLFKVLGIKNKERR